MPIRCAFFGCFLSKRLIGLDALVVSTLFVCGVFVCGCEYEWKEEARSPEPYPVQQLAVNDQVAQQTEKPKQAAPPPEVKPVLAPGKDVSGQAVLPPKARKLNLLELKDTGVLNVTANLMGGDMPQAFDEREDTLAKSEGFNPFTFTFEFTEPRMLKAVRVLSSYSDYSWALQVDQGERLVVDMIIDGEWSTIAWPDGLKGKRIQVEVLRKHRDNYVHLNEVEIYE
jgi:hypothetical protein